MKTETQEEKGIRTTDLGWAAIKWLLLGAFVLVVLGVGLGILISNVDDNVDDNTESIAEMKEEVREVRRLVRHLDNFVAGLEEETPDELEQSAAVSRAVALVPDVKAILCEEFPDAQACQEE